MIKLKHFLDLADRACIDPNTLLNISGVICTEIISLIATLPKDTRTPEVIKAIHEHFGD